MSGDAGHDDHGHGSPWWETAAKLALGGLALVLLGAALKSCLSDTGTGFRDFTTGIGSGIANMAGAMGMSPTQLHLTISGLGISLAIALGALNYAANFRKIADERAANAKKYAEIEIMKAKAAAAPAKP